MNHVNRPADATEPKKGKRRKAGEGTMFQRKDGTWVGALSLGPRNARTRKVIYGKTPVQVRDELTKLKAKVLSGLPLVQRDENMTLGKYLEGWLATPDCWQPETLRVYKGLVDRHVSPRIGSVRLARLRPADVQNMMTAMEVSGASARLRQMALGVLSNALRRAVRMEQVVRNVCDAVTKPRAPLPDVNAMAREQVEQFLAAARTEPVKKCGRVIGTRVHRLYALYVLAFSTGMRQGELLGLQWLDVDLDAKSLSVRHTLGADNDGMLSLGATKTNSSRRKIELSESVVQALSEHRDRMKAECRKASRVISLFVFCDTDGNPLRKDNVRGRSFETILTRAKLPHFRFHDMRHTFATLALEAGVHPKVVQEMLGHASIRMTLDRYSHVTPTMQRDAAGKMDVVLRRALDK